MSRLEGRVAVVTGAGSGLGGAISTPFSAGGAAGGVADTHPATGQETAAMINERSGSAIAIQTDIRRSDDVRDMIERTIAEFRQLDILVNNAGVQVDANVVETSEGDWNFVLDVNLKGTFLCCKY